MPMDLFLHIWAPGGATRLHDHADRLLLVDAPRAPAYTPIIFLSIRRMIVPLSPLMSCVFSICPAGRWLLIRSVIWWPV